VGIELASVIDRARALAGRANVRDHRPVFIAKIIDAHSLVRGLFVRSAVSFPNAK
jgi:hypothetical protein